MLRLELHAKFSSVPMLVEQISTGLVKVPRRSDSVCKRRPWEHDRHKSRNLGCLRRNQRNKLLGFEPIWYRWFDAPGILRDVDFSGRRGRVTRFLCAKRKLKLLPSTSSRSCPGRERKMPIGKNYRVVGFRRVRKQHRHSSRFSGDDERPKILPKPLDFGFRAFLRF